MKEYTSTVTVSFNVEVSVLADYPEQARRFLADPSYWTEVPPFEYENCNIEVGVPEECFDPTDV